jgi:chromosome partitioning protein
MVYQQLVAETNLLGDLLETARQRCHVVVVDTPPGLGPVVRRVLEASQHVLVPLQCEPLALQTTPQILRGIQDIAATNEQLTLDGILLTMYDSASPACARVSDYVRRNLPSDMVFDTVIPRSAAAADAFAAGQPVVLRDPADAAAQAYVNLATHLAERFQ